jgi:quinoprotein glucose dehydrogenase
VRAAAIQQGFARKLDGLEAVALEAVKGGPMEAARAAIAGLPVATVTELWKARAEGVRRELWLDLFLRLQTAAPDALKDLAGLPQTLAEFGGDVRKGEAVFRNQGACLQCHLMNGEGGVQGPDLTTVAKRLSRDKILESLINPNAVIAEGYGMSSATLKDGTTLLGRLAKETEQAYVFVGVDGKESTVKRTEVVTVTPPVSAMPPMAMALPLPDLRDLVSYLASRTRAVEGAGGKADHGESRDEKIAK